jgi:hypothetical protein
MKRTPQDYSIDGFTIFSFTADTKQLELTQEYEADSRKVIDSEANVLMIFTASLDVITVEDEKQVSVGRLQGREYWEFVSFDERFESYVSACPVRDYHWKDLQDAEIAIATRILETLLSKDRIA